MDTPSKMKTSSDPQNFTEEIVYQWDQTWSRKNLDALIDACKNDTVALPYYLKYFSKNERILECGYGKRTDIDEYKIQNRGGSGIKTAKVTAKTGALISAKVFEGEDAEVVAISKKSQVIRTDVKEIPVLGRQTQGVRVMKLRDGDSIASLICL
jgi:DNA gyrase subunit A